MDGGSVGAVNTAVGPRGPRQGAPLAKEHVSAPQQKWSNVEVGLNQGDETGCFGPRKEKGSALYQVETAASIAPADPAVAKDFPSISVVASSRALCTLIGSQVHIFDSGCSSLRATLNLGDVAEHASWSNKGTFLVVASRDGVIHFVDADTKRVLFSQALCKPSTGGGSTFAGVHFCTASSIELTPDADTDTEGDHIMVALTSTGQLFHFAEIELDGLRACIEAADHAGAQAVRERIQVTQTSVAKEHTETINGAAAVTIRGEPHVVTWGSGRLGICLWTPTAKGPVLRVGVGRALRGKEVVHAAATKDGKLVALTSDTALSVWLLPDLVQLILGPSGFTQFELFEHAVDDAASESEATEVRMSAITKSLDGTSSFKIFSLRGMKEHYALELSPTAVIANVADQESMWVVEGKHSGTADMAYQMRCLSPTLPLNRFYNLLHKQKFDEAVQLAHLFELDLEMVHRVKVTSLLDAADKDSSQPGLVKQLQQSLEFVADDDFVTDSCLQASMPTVGDTATMLRFGLERLASKPATGEIFTLKTRVHNAMKRLASFRLATCGSSNFDATAWHHFRSVDLLRELISCLSEGRIDAAEVIWARHASEYDMPSEMTTILSSIPEHFPLGQAIGWLANHVFPRAMPQHHTFLLEWANTRARSLELSEKKGWPENALTLVNACACVLEAHGYGAMERMAIHTQTPADELDCFCGRESDEDPNLSSASAADVVAESIEDILQLKQQLEDLLYLRDILGCSIPFSTYLTETPTSLLAKQLEQVTAPELVSSAIEDRAVPYLKRHDLSTNDFLLRYLAEFMGSIDSVASPLSGSAWEAKAIVIVSHIRDTATRMRGILELMRRATVPPSKEVDQLIQSALACDGGHSTEVREQFRIMELRAMLQRYGIQGYNLTDMSLARGLLLHIVSRDDVPNAIDDALTLVAAYHHLTPVEAYVARLQHLTETRCFEECDAVLESMSPSDAVRVCTEMRWWTDDVLAEDPIVPGDDDMKMASATVVLKCLDAVLNADVSSGITDSRSSSAHKAARMYRSITAIFAEFGTHVSPVAFKDRSAALDFIDSNLVGLCAENDISAYLKFCRLVDLLGTPRDVVAVHLAKQCSVLHTESRQARLALRFVSDYCTSLSTSATNHGTVAFQVARSLISQIAGSKDTPSIADDVLRVYKIAQQAVSGCPKILLGDALELTKHCELMHAVYRQCESGDYDATVKAVDGEASTNTTTHEARLFAHFKESGLVLDSATVLPMVSRFIELAMPREEFDGVLNPSRLAAAAVEDAATSIEQISSLSTCAQGIIRYLTDNGLSQLGLSYSVRVLGICAQHYTLNSGKPKITGVFKAVSSRGISVVSELTQVLLSKVLAHASVDRKLAIGYITMLDLKSGWGKFRKAIAATKKNFERLAELTLIGIGFAKLWSQNGIMGECELMHKRAVWWSKLAALGVKFDRRSFESDPAEYAESLVTAVMQATGCNVEFVTRFATDHGMKTDALTALVVPLLLELRPTVGQKECAGSDAEYQVQIRRALAHVSDKSKILATLEAKHRHLVGPYDYDRLRFLFKLVLALEADVRAVSPVESPVDEATPDAESSRSWAHNGLLLLEVLWHYKRRALPAKAELDFVARLQHGDSGPQDADGLVISDEWKELATKRLPFHVLAYGDALSVITPELCLETAHSLSPLAKLLPGELKPDDFLVTLLQQLLQTEDTLPTLQHLSPIYAKISDDETALMAAKMIADSYPVGVNKISALKLGIDRASSWSERLPPDTEEKKGAEHIRNRMAALCDTVETEHLIVRGCFETEDSPELLEQPVQLVEHLYETHLIACSGSLERLAALHNVVDNVAHRYNFESKKIRKALIQRWLSTPCDNATTSTSLSAGSGADAPLSLAGVLDEDDEETATGSWHKRSLAFPVDANLSRATILLRHSQADNAITQLVNFAFTDASAKVNVETQLRALLALCSAIPAGRITEVSGRGVDELREHVLTLHYVDRLATLEVQYTAASFASGNKEGIVRSLWREHRTVDVAVTLVIDMCIDYMLYDLTLWSNSLQALADLSMWPELARALMALSSIPDLWLLPCLPELWKRTLDAYLKHVEEFKQFTDLQAFEELLLQSPYLVDECYQTMASRALQATGAQPKEGSDLIEQLRAYAADK